MNKTELIDKLKSIDDRGGRDEEVDHMEADQLLLDYINDEEITMAFDSIKKWYA